MKDSFLALLSPIQGALNLSPDPKFVLETVLMNCGVAKIPKTYDEFQALKLGLSKD
jgi:hypothetical protein